jgi:hypothetical protein
MYSGGLTISCCATFLPVRFAMRGVTQGARSASLFFSAAVRPRSPTSLRAVRSWCRSYEHKPKRGSTAAAGKNFGSISGGCLVSCGIAQGVRACAGLAVGVVRAVDRVALGGAGMGQFRRWLRSRNPIAIVSASFSPRLLRLSDCVHLSYNASCDVARGHGAVKGRYLECTII